MISFVLHPVQFKRYQKKIMKLESFIAETLCQIINGVSQASKYAQQNDAEINPLVKDFSHETGCAYTGDRITSVDFDVAVTASSETKKKENVGVSVVQVILGTERTIKHLYGLVSVSPSTLNHVLSIISAPTIMFLL